MATTDARSARRQLYAASAGGSMVLFVLAVFMGLLAGLVIPLETAITLAVGFLAVGVLLSVLAVITLVGGKTADRLAQFILVDPVWKKHQ